MGFVVIEGLDGSGKSTQLALLREYLDKEGIRYKYLHFPRLETGVYGKLVARFLRGEMGANEAVDPYLVALIYAGNRLDSKHKILGWLKQGITVIVDRYVLSNIAFQCAKLEGGKERDDLRKWILEFEYGYHRIPRPDISIFLDVPFTFTARQLSAARDGQDRMYLNGKPDIHEQDLGFQKRVREVYLGLASTDPGLHVLECAGEEGEMLSPEKIFGKMMNLLFQ